MSGLLTINPTPSFLVQYDFVYKQFLPNIIYSANYSLQSIYFLTRLNGYAVAQNTNQILQTSDGGNNWQIIYTVNNPIFPANTLGLTNIVFPSTKVGFVVGSSLYNNQSGGLEFGGICLRTTDGGQSWVTLKESLDTALNDISFSSPADIYLVGATPDYYGLILHTADTGSNWTKLVVKSGINEVSFNAITQKNGIVLIAGQSGTNPFIHYSLDNGSTWRSYTVENLEASANAVAILNTQPTPTLLVGLSSGAIISSNDNGLSWQTNNLPNAGIEFTNFLFVNTGNGFASGFYTGLFADTILYVTKDTAKTWQGIYLPSIQNKTLKITDMNLIIGQ
ncbi:MAG: YCF48-related protein [Phycisphaerales bacterium]|nr:YCF48-related protein [Phycisphaerales bacterium]